MLADALSSDLTTLKYTGLGACVMYAFKLCFDFMRWQQSRGDTKAATEAPPPPPPAPPAECDAWEAVKDLQTTAHAIQTQLAVMQEHSKIATRAGEAQSDRINKLLQLAETHSEHQSQVSEQIEAVTQLVGASETIHRRKKRQ